MADDVERVTDTEGPEVEAPAAAQPKAKTKPAGKKAAAPADDAQVVKVEARPDRVAELEAELARLRSENEVLRSGKPSFTPGRRYRVSVKGGPASIVEPNPGEHPHDAFCRVAGIQRSDSPFESHETTEELGHVQLDGRIKPYA
jgi:hypothetical protein